MIHLVNVNIYLAIAPPIEYIRINCILPSMNNRDRDAHQPLFSICITQMGITQPTSKIWPMDDLLVTTKN